ncbi:YncE family protein [Robertkochia solimangrovi]|uniref:YncE family protein n=1 Tax=Robertkochia solimangrovi TaxID=2213046 RepID=UPI00117E2EF8|nr:YncE family protein [Robertkochia solimangrovi]TRZ43653.1 YncE family protein [Robertkochia solimangrovi]
MKQFKRFGFALLGVLFLVSCSNDDDTTEIITGDYANGILITNEGPFNNGTGTLSFIPQDLSQIENEVYQGVNDEELGNIVQSLGFAGDDAYVVVNNSNRIVVADRYTLENTATIEEGQLQPRAFAGTNDKGFVTNWGDPYDNDDDFVSVIDLDSKTVTGEIPVDFGPEKILYNGTYIYVAHQGGYGQNNLISVIDPTDETVVKTITVAYSPNSMVISGNTLWVLCGGKPSYADEETAGELVKIDMTTNEVTLNLAFGVTDHPSNLTAAGSNMFYTLNGGVYQTTVSTQALPDTAAFEGSFYSLTAHDGYLFGTDAGDYASRGSVIIFDITNFNQVQTFTAGIIPGGVYFND